MSRGIFVGAAVLGTMAMLTMTLSTLIWMTVPAKIVYRDSSAVRTEVYSIRVVEHGHSYFLTPGQKRVLDWVRNGTARVWFSCFGIIVVSILVGAAARLRMKEPLEDSFLP